MTTTVSIMKLLICSDIKIFTAFYHLPCGQLNGTLQKKDFKSFCLVHKKLEPKSVRQKRKREMQNKKWKRIKLEDGAREKIDEGCQNLPRDFWEPLRVKMNAESKADVECERLKVVKVGANVAIKPIDFDDVMKEMIPSRVRFDNFNIYY